VTDPSHKGPWMLGPVPDLMLACGLGYFLVFLVFCAGGSPLRLAQPAFVSPLLSVLISGPHYGATLLRAYERREDRRAYALFAVWATLLVYGVFAWSLFDAWIASWFYTIFLTWSPWHYTGQNFGVAMIFARRAGGEVTPWARRLLHYSFITSYAVFFLVLHTLAEGATAYNPDTVQYETEIQSLQLGIPTALGHALIVFATLVYAVSTVGAAALLVRTGNSRALLPIGFLVLTQALWFGLPISFQYWGLASGLDPLDSGMPHVYVFWAAMGHAIQYHFITVYFARASSSWPGHRAYLGKCLAAGAAIWTLPAILLAPDLVGGWEFNAGLGVMVAAAVNVHHFILDGAIWKLRKSRIASILIRSERDDAAAPIAPPRWRVPGWAVWSVLGGFAAIRIGMVGLEEFTFKSAMQSQNLSRADSVLDALNWLGRDSSSRRAALGDALAREGDTEGAEAQYRRSLELRSTVGVWTRVAAARSGRSDWEGVLEAYDAARRLPASAPSGLLRGLAMQAYYETGQPERARAVLEDLASRADPRAEDLARLGGVAIAAGDTTTAVEAYEGALRLEPGRHSTANNLAWILATDEASARDPSRAVELAELAVRDVDPADLNYLDTLATAYAAADRPEDAIATHARILGLATERGDDAAARAARAGLERLGGG